MTTQAPSIPNHLDRDSVEDAGLRAPRCVCGNALRSKVAFAHVFEHPLRVSKSTRLKAVSTTASRTPSPVHVALDAERTLTLSAAEGRASLSVQRHGLERPELELEIVMTSAGPVVRTRAVGLEIEAAESLVARCREFRVEAEESISLVSRGAIESRAGTSMHAHAQQVTVEATRGNVLMRANDDVQLLGEQILLNCDRDPPLPPWIPAAAAPYIPPQTLPLAGESGDAALLAPRRTDDTPEHE